MTTRRKRSGLKKRERFATQRVLRCVKTLQDLGMLKWRLNNTNMADLVATISFGIQEGEGDNSERVYALLYGDFEDSDPKVGLPGDVFTFALTKRQFQGLTSSKTMTAKTKRAIR